MKKTIDEYSVTALPIWMKDGVKPLATGTAFVWRGAESDYLITNWHNVTGKNPNTGAYLSASESEPDRVVVAMHVQNALGNWKPHDVPLRDPDGGPMWYEHPKHRRDVDVVAIPLDVPDGLVTYPINTLNEAARMTVTIAQDVFILGFPFKLAGGGALPIWKRASIATEPSLDQGGLPKILVDTASRSGMSGSPVIRRSWGSYNDEQGNIVMGGGTSTRFIGVYSGRIGAENEFKAQLGIVWRRSAIEEIVGARIAGSS